MAYKAIVLVLAVFLGLTSGLKLNKGLKAQDQLNPVNSSVTYNESNLINTTMLGIPFLGEFRTGYIIVNTTTQSRYFYWLYAAGGAKNSAAKLTDDAPLILWLQGGPGCADGTGQFNEVGPYTIVNKSGKLEPSSQAINWNDKYHLLFLDNPVGVGYSVGTDNVNTAVMVSEYIQTFLIRLFQVYPKLAAQPLYVFAESYGGHYGPAVVKKLVENNTANGIKITGLGVVDGWVNPYFQATSYAEFAYAAGLIDPKIRDTMKNVEVKVKEAYLGQQYTTVADLFGSLTDYVGYQNINVYSFRQYNDDPTIGGSPYPDWLNNNTVKTNLGVDTSVDYNDCVSSSYTAFLADLGSSYADSVSYILSSTTPKVKVLIMNGADDFIVNSGGVERYLRELNWPGLNNWLQADKAIWWKNATSQDYAWGTLKRYDRLTYAVVNEAGHEVPMYVPDSARDLLERFVTDKW